MSLKRTIVAAVSISAVLCATTAHAQLFGFGGATEMTQIANNAQLLAQRALQEQTNLQLSTHTDILSLIRSNTSDIDKSTTNTLPEANWLAIQSHFLELSNSAQQANSLLALAADTAATFSTMYGNYVPGFDFLKKYKDWSKATMNGIQNAVKGTALQQGNVLSRESLLQGLQVMGASTTGQLQAMQVLIQLASINAQQMQELQALMTHQLQIQQLFLAQQTHKGSVLTDTMQALVTRPLKRTPTYFKGGSN